MNVVYLHCHDVGKHLSCYGAKVATPNLQKLADNGLVFDKCFTVSPTCSPSRGCLVTSMYPSENGLVGLAHLGFKINDYKKHIASYLSSQGVQTQLFGVQHETGVKHNTAEIVELGYDNYSSGQEFDHQISAEAVKFLENHDDKQFFLSVGFYRPHRQFPVDPTIYTGEEVPPKDVPVTPETKQDTADFNRETTYMDKCAGEVIDACMKRGDTAIIFTTDHGVPFPKHKCFMYDKGINISFIQYIPDGAKGRVSAMVDHLDFMPTVCDMLGVETPEYARGKSLMCYQNGYEGEIHDEIYGEINFHFVREEVRSIRTPKYKLIKHYSWDKYPGLNTDYSICKQIEYDNGLYDVVRKIEFFDLEKDPDEHNNLHGNAEYKQVEEDLLAKIQAHMEMLSDPLLKGPMKLKKGQVCRQNLDIMNYHKTGQDNIPLEATEE